MSKLQNEKNIPLSLAVWLARDTYDYIANPAYFSATELLKHSKQITLSRRIDRENSIVDIHDLVPSRIGTAIHDSIEKAWNADSLVSILDALGFNKLSHKIRVNPAEDSLEKDVIPVYMEKRITKEIDGYKIGGKYDFIFDGTLIDFKSTSTFTYVNKSNDSKYQLQGSIYRWLNPNIITDDFMEIHFIFTDWKPTIAKTQADYPQARAMSYKIPLLSLEETEQYIKRKLQVIESFADAEEKELEPCNDEALWRKETVYKYYRDLTKTARATKNFTNSIDANTHAATLASKNPGGGVLEIKGEVVACRYCDAFNICKQKNMYILSGELKA